MTYQVKLDVFEGPFDLLLHLISKRQVDITEVDLAEITADFLASLEGLEGLELETATHFLVVAATLIELKAARLLPADEREELEDLLGEARDVLYARLLEYRAFRQAAAVLERRAEANGAFVARDVALEPRFRRAVPDTDLGTTTGDLASLAARALAPRPEPHVDITHIRKTYLSVRAAAATLLSQLGEEGGTATFGELVEGRPRSDRIVFFLSVLELYKLGQLDLVQPAHEAELRLSRRGSGNAGAGVSALLDTYGGGSSGEDEPEMAASRSRSG